MKSLTWTIPYFMFGVISCSNEEETVVLSECPTVHNYSTEFLHSDFYTGWKYLQDSKTLKTQCDNAIPYFAKGIDNASVFELSTLYFDYCQSIIRPEKHNLDVDLNNHHLPLLTQSSIYRGENLAHGIDHDEFQWVLDLAFCDSPVEQYALGKMLIDGFITDRNIDKGVYFLSLASHQEHIQAQIALAQVLITLDESDAAELWLEKAKQNGAGSYTSNFQQQ